MSTPTHAVTVRIPEPLYRSARDLAQSRGISVAAFAREAIDEKTRSSVDVDLAAAYETLAADPEEADVEPFLCAQAETLDG